MLDEFNSEQPNDYLAGFPSHPHRGFETVTYMLEGKMQHEDHLGNRGLLQPGDVQWMTAARGIIHSEMPQQLAGRMRGFQLWINLPADEKMKDPSYRDIPSEQIPIFQQESVWVKVIAGEFRYQQEVIQGAVTGIATRPLYLDIRLEAGGNITIPVAKDHRLLVYVFEGTAQIEQQSVASQHMALTSEGDGITLDGGKHGCRLLVLAGKPLHEPIAHWGPFVMNTEQEIVQAIQDYRNGTLTQ
jgi:hypothetical protein